jgi:hypothetical protein
MDAASCCRVSAPAPPFVSRGSDLSEASADGFLLRRRSSPRSGAASRFAGWRRRGRGRSAPSRSGSPHRRSRSGGPGAPSWRRRRQQRVRLASRLFWGFGEEESVRICLVLPAVRGLEVE